MDIPAPFDQLAKRRMRRVQLKCLRRGTHLLLTYQAWLAMAVSEPGGREHRLRLQPVLRWCGFRENHHGPERSTGYTSAAATLRYCTRGLSASAAHRPRALDPHASLALKRGPVFQAGCE
jgi:hypothetical protein